MTKVLLAVIPSGAALFVDSRLAEAELAGLRAAEVALEEERQRAAPKEAPTKPTTEAPARRLLGTLGAKAAGFF